MGLPAPGFPRGGKAAFTLIELLSVVVILTVLVTLTLASGKIINQKVNDARCVSNLRQIGIALISAAMDNNGYIPPVRQPYPEVVGSYGANNAIGYLVRAPEGWGGTAAPLGDTGVLFCPSQKNVTYPDSTTAYGRLGWAKEGYYAGYIFFIISSTGGTADNLPTNNIRYPGANAVAMDYGCTLNGLWAGSIVAARAHQTFNNVLHLDGHVSEVSAGDVNNASSIPALMSVLSKN